MIAIMGLFIHIWPTKFWFHWIERNRLKKLYDDKDDVYFHALEDMYGTVPHLRKYAERKSKIVKWLTMITAIAVLASLFVITFDADMYIWSTIIMTISPLIMAALYKLWNAPNLKYDPGIENGAYFKKWREEHKK
ncbi:MAG TPA: hypothetical protein VEC16_03960 [Alphaproteobacteria bacterium]|nr:hypothetical protein [Alphaproteobacteria bacterium]